MSLRILAVLALVSMAPIRLSPQDALVVELSKEESARASQLYKQLSAAEAEWLNFREAIRDKYGPLLSKSVPKERLTIFQKRDRTEIYMPEEWAHGVEFSSDFHYAVPARPR